MLIRQTYLQQLIDSRDLPLIKVLTGVRRAGKSTLLRQYQDYLLAHGVDLAHVIYLNFESGETFSITDFRELYQEIKNRLPTSGKTYIFLDEVQNVLNWERAVNSFLVDFDCDVYITGSNAYLLSSELTTLLAGRVLTIKVFPLSFAEFCQAAGELHDLPVADVFHHYLTFGGMPMLTQMTQQNSDLAWNYLSDLKEVVVKKDVIARGQIKDVVFLDNLIKYLASVTGCLTTGNKIADYMRQNGRVITHQTVDTYLQLLENAYLVYRLPRFELAGKQLLKTQGKYYFVDTGLRNAVAGLSNYDSGAAIENVVCLELLRRHYELFVGQYQEIEVDFVAVSPQEQVYFQVTRSLSDPAVWERETRALLNIKDNHRKVILTLDQGRDDRFEGIEIVNLYDFLLGQA